MPYIKQIRRDNLWSGDTPNNSGELNYCFTEISRQYFEANGSSYQQINDILGALEGAKLEFYRRVAVPFEEEKIKTNGDVY